MRLKSEINSSVRLTNWCFTHFRWTSRENKFPWQQYTVF